MQTNEIIKRKTQEELRGRSGGVKKKGKRGGEGGGGRGGGGEGGRGESWVNGEIKIKIETALELFSEVGCDAITPITCALKISSNCRYVIIKMVFKSVTCVLVLCANLCPDVLVC
jgi:hypothetical protein